MALIKPSEPWAQTAEDAAQRHGYAANSELALRNSLEAFCRQRWPKARIVHEMVMGGRQVRADVVAIGEHHIVAFEVKGAHDDTTRLLHQVGLYQLCVPEVWMVVASNHDSDADLIRFLLPSIGIISAPALDRHWRAAPEGINSVELKVVAEPVPRQPHKEMMLEMMWAAELGAICSRLGLDMGPRATRPQMIRSLMSRHDNRALMTQCCLSLRSRDALWRADAPLRHSGC